MRERLSEVLRVEEQVHGLVSDAAHKIFKDRSKLLITTSSYSPIIKRWLPVLYSFNNGGTIEHFRHHFLTLFRSLVRQPSHACTTHILLNRSLILLLLREGFILAYIDLHLESSHEKRSRQLRDAAKQCLKGCQEHLRAAVSQIIALLAFDRFDELQAAVAEFYKAFPSCSKWLGWWLNDARAHMLFKAVTDMLPGTWNLAPHTTNAQESQHSMMRCSIGYDNEVFAGWRGLC
ncbi:hypothetical protein BDV98DRAFT_515367 [Pterulicium gracile]|uniref:MULE transposase domain-containing protein n=1 Tax=Pterulicium gracile TaxID=1884261 RepID=A0A5C3Q6F6_9AGAR|nr:hypothetical protein BDV98DRAFT_515367 [Pterula gracilis]